ncbi:flagellar basal body-associated FliL family protein [Desulfovibrio litoralis]|uniref:Flagellar protein FliL n=1 Tax=Desulfovibrio litoralis DSM 11393 TaxID=1121455 RepID=A0A1M7TBA5_9BACT|nr:flagellar basal body-associated FliL family protein [Desulfovibrio litoralis]SHN67957.1 flagellar FliL protein [Desulfovibrio litoralis DSM 11393]
MAENEKEKKSGKGKFIIIILVILALLGGGGFAAWKFLLPIINKTESVATEGGHAPGGSTGSTGEAKDNKNANTLETSIVTLPTFVVNLQDPVGRRFIKLSMDIDVVGSGVKDDITRLMPRIKDTINMLLSSKSYADLAMPESKVLLKSEIVERVNLVLGGSKVKDVYFTEFIIQ